MEESVKYFVPDISDIRVGYEYEQLVGNPQDDIIVNGPTWQKCKFPDPFTGGDVLKLKNRNIRVPYLTKEQIETEGWEFQSFDKVLNVLSFKIQLSKTSWLELDYHTDTKSLIIEKVWTNGDDNMGLFNGECKDINTFRTICKLLNI